MKKILLFLVCSLTLFYQTFAQVQIPNGGFESWGNHIRTLTPTHYLCTNDFYAQFDFIAGVRRTEGVTRFTPSNSGDNAVKIANVVGRLAEDNSVLDTLPSFLVSSSNPSLEGQDSGFPCNQRPTTLNGYFQFNQGSESNLNKDTAVIAVAFTKWNATKQAPDTIGTGFLKIHQTQSGYSFFSVPVNYLSETTPDSAAIFITSAINSIIASPSTYLVVDDLSFGGLTTGVKSTDYINGLVPVLYPNPAIADVTINNIVPNASAIDIMDMTGKVIQTMPINGETATFNLGGLKAGMYLYRMVDLSHNVLYTDRFAKTE
ncbi:T9SS type A sorting domain-containing protein [Sporocytophaga myxococcoides]|uniref:T9SS type A sorting domain-containing protein n=1 Tax=Sporocytophaga myxococcoides TaxID=153721 RepID=UPI00048A7798|nr:T9SS type A sorting domain-containing protein [Sporocytophaga myxococcoides]